MSDIRTGRGHLPGLAQALSQGENSRAEPDAAGGASRSGRRPSQDLSLPPSDGKAISHRVAEAMPAAVQSDAAVPASMGLSTVGGEFIHGVFGAGMEMRRSAHLPHGRLIHVVREYVSAAPTLWKRTVTQLAAAAQYPDVQERCLREAFCGVACGLESAGLSTAEGLRSDFAFVMKELLGQRLPQQAIVSAVMGWHDGLVTQRPKIDLKALVALRKSLQQGLAEAVQHPPTADRCPLATHEAVLTLLRAPQQAVIEDLVGLLNDPKARSNLESRLVSRVVAEFKSANEGTPVKWMASLLKAVEVASDDMDRAVLARGQDGTLLVLQAVFKSMPLVMENHGTAHVTSLVSALALGLPADRVMLAWMRAHAATLLPAERVDLAMSVLVQHDKFKLAGPALTRAFAALAQGLAPSSGDSKAAAGPDDHAGVAGALAKWATSLQPGDISFRMFSGLARGFGFTAGNGGGPTLAAVLKGVLGSSPPDVKRALDILRSWSLGLCPYETSRDHPAKAADLERQIRAYFQAAIDEVLPIFTPEVVHTRKALLHALYAPPAKKG